MCPGRPKCGGPEAEAAQSAQDAGAALIAEAASAAKAALAAQDAEAAGRRVRPRRQARRSHQGQTARPPARRLDFPTPIGRPHEGALLSRALALTQLGPRGTIAPVSTAIGGTDRAGARIMAPHGARVCAALQVVASLGKTPWKQIAPKDHQVIGQAPGERSIDAGSLNRRCGTVLPFYARMCMCFVIGRRARRFVVSEGGRGIVLPVTCMMRRMWFVWAPRSLAYSCLSRRIALFDRAYLALLLLDLVVAFSSIPQKQNT